MVGTMHSSGADSSFARLAGVGANADRVPLLLALTSEQDDPDHHRLDIQRERCLRRTAS